MLKIQEFLKCNSDWECLLSSEPYCLSISHDTVNGRDLTMFKYDQIRSDLSIPLVQECRGLILDAHTFEVVSHPFHKFFNYGEELAADIDWKTAWTSSKIDGSIIKVVNLDGSNFLISTNGVISAFKCSVSDSVGCPFKTFGELFMEGMKFYGLTMEDFPRLFRPGFTYMFELTSPWNQVVVQWKETKVWFIGVRDNRTGKEIRFFDDHELSKIFDTPKVFPMRSFDDVVKAAKELPDDEEGYVVCDSGFRRVKVKSPRYVQLHYMAGNQTWSASRVIDIIRDNEVSEYVAYFPKFKAAFDVVKAKYDAYVDELKDVKDAIDDLMVVEWDITKKDFAKWVFAINTIRPYSGFAFAYFDSVYAKTKKDDAVVKSVEEYLANMPTSKLVEALGL